MTRFKRFPVVLVLAWSVAASTFGHSAAQGEWQEHHIRQGDGKGGWLTRPALRQVLKHPDATATMPFGLVQMAGGEIAILGSREKQPAQGPRAIEPIVAFSQDGGTTWSDFTIVPETTGRPQYLQWLGGGRLSFITEVFNNAGKPQRIFSNDYGRTWNERIDHPPTKEGRSFGVEGNAWIDRDEKGAPRAILELGWHLLPGKSHPKDDFNVVFRRSIDGGRTWMDEVSPPQWKFTVEHNGNKWLRGVSEGAIVRATNGDLVAALRTDMPPRYFDEKNDDSLEGTAISISHDDGKTWSDLNILFDAGRHHANLQRLPNGDLVCTLIVRDDIQDGKLASHRRGCDALISQDHGKTWNLDRRYELDRFDFLRADGYWVDGVCGHTASVTLNDGHVISVYGNYSLGAVLIKWKPDAKAAQPVSPPPIRPIPGLFDQAKPDTLGLATVRGEHAVLYRANDTSYKYSHHPNLGAFQGRLYAMWSSGLAQEDGNGQRVLYCHSDDGVRWSEPAVLVQDPDGDGPLACMAAGFHTSGKRLTAYYTVFSDDHRTYDRDSLHYLTSENGQTWSAPQRLTAGCFIESPRHLPSGRLLLNGQMDPARPRLIYSDAADGISEWRDADLPTAKGFSWPEPSWFQRGDGTVVMLFRRQTPNAQAVLYASTSQDDARTWSPPIPTEFPDATARFAAGNLPDGTAYVINNPSHTPSKEYHFIGRRNPLTISLSRDGVSFNSAFIIRGEPTAIRYPGKNKTDGWQYPAAVAWQDHLYVAYSINKEDIGVTRIALSTLAVKE